MRLWHLFPTGSFAFLDVLKDLIQQHVQNAGEQESAAAVQPLEFPPGVDGNISDDLAWLLGTEWVWTVNGSSVTAQFHDNGKLVGEGDLCAGRTGCIWSANGGAVHMVTPPVESPVYYKLKPSSMVPDQSVLALKKTTLRGQAEDGSRTRAKFSRIFDALAYVPGTDLYAVLGVDEDADVDHIRRTFRRLSLEFHPDRNRCPNATERFAKIQEAYAILSTKHRVLYDTAHRRAIALLRHGKAETSESITLKAQIPLRLLYGGFEYEARIPRQVVCARCAHRPDNPRCEHCSPCPNITRVKRRVVGAMIIEEHEEEPTKEFCRVEPVELTVAVEPGMRDDDVITYDGLGHQVPGKIPGDIVFEIEVLPEDSEQEWTSVKDDLHTIISLSLRQALLGFERTIDHVGNHHVVIRRDGFTKPGAVITVIGEGMPRKEDPATYGDLHVHINVEFPDEDDPDIEEIGRSLPRGYVGDIPLHAAFQ
jgi:DnaJ-class molecular chaperone